MHRCMHTLAAVSIRASDDCSWTSDTMSCTKRGRTSQILQVLRFRVERTFRTQTGRYCCGSPGLQSAVPSPRSPSAVVLTASCPSPPGMGHAGVRQVCVYSRQAWNVMNYHNNIYERENGTHHIWYTPSNIYHLSSTVEYLTGSAY